MDNGFKLGAFVGCLIGGGATYAFVSAYGIISEIRAINQLRKTMSMMEKACGEIHNVKQFEKDQQEAELVKFRKWLDMQ